MATKTNPRTVTYVYCVIQAREVFALPRSAEGLPGFGRPRLIDGGPKRLLVVADAPRAQYGADAIRRGLGDLDWVSRCAVAHASMVEACLPAQAVVPMKLFTIFETDDRAVSDLARNRALARALRRVSGRVEWGVRIRYGRQAAPRPIGARPRTGAQYLSAKRSALALAKREAGRVAAQADQAFRYLATHAVASARQTLPAQGTKRAEARLVLDAAFLVNAGPARPFRAAVKRLDKDLTAQGYRVEVTGPWPAYNFIES